ncbi:hypothetical protein SAMN05428939_7741 [Streptomyces sp. TLI_105]|nr:hypothetical protein SAMN05428939_7741 [Streptomyces sp. TLI_105]
MGLPDGPGELTTRHWSLLDHRHLSPAGGGGGRWSDHRTVIKGVLFRDLAGLATGHRRADGDFPRL